MHSWIFFVYKTIDICENRMKKKEKSREETILEIECHNPNVQELIKLGVLCPRTNHAS
jgi:hypothetical protein